MESQTQPHGVGERRHAAGVSLLGPFPCAVWVRGSCAGQTLALGGPACDGTGKGQTPSHHPGLSGLTAGSPSTAAPFSVGLRRPLPGHGLWGRLGSVALQPCADCAARGTRSWLPILRSPPWDLVLEPQAPHPPCAGGNRLRRDCVVELVIARGLGPEWLCRGPRVTSAPWPGRFCLGCNSSVVLPSLHHL